MALLGEAYYRDILLQLQNEFDRAVDAYEQQMDCLTQHNTLLLTVQAHHHERIQQLEAQVLESKTRESQQEERLKMQHEEFVGFHVQHESLRHECDALQILMQQEQTYWRNYQKSKEEEVQALAAQVLERDARITNQAKHVRTLEQEMEHLHARIEKAVGTSRQFEYRLQKITQQKQRECQTLEVALRQCQRELKDQKTETKYLTQALMQYREDQVAAPPARPQQSQWKENQTPSHAPTSPTSSAFGWTPPSTPEKPWEQPTQRPSSSSQLPPRSSRLERELGGLRVKLEACTRFEDQEDNR